MSTRVPGLRALPDRLRGPLTAPVLSGVLAFLAWQASAALGQSTLLVVTRPIPAGAHISAGDVRRVAWHGPLPQGALREPEGYARFPIARGVPLLADETTASPIRSGSMRVVGIPASAIFSSPALTTGESVSVLYLSPGGQVETVVRGAVVVQTGSQGYSLRIPEATLRALVLAAAAGHLVLVRLGV